MAPYGSGFSSDDDDAVFINRDDVSNYNEENILPESPAVIAQIRAWLDPTDYSIESSEYGKHLASHLDGTGTWLESSSAYQRWHDSKEDGLLWIKGIPGSGKSVFAATLAHKLSQEGVPVLYFFFRQIIDANHKPISLLRDWLDQVLLYSPPLQAALKQYVQAERSLDSLAAEELWRHLRTALVQLPLVYCVADALDEMDQGNDDFIHALADLGEWRPSRVKVLMTSRPVANIETPMRQRKHIDIRLEERFVDVDIATYVNYNLKNTQIPDSDQDLIRSAVPGRANGLFLYAKLAMNAFLEPNADVESILTKLPLDLNDMYIRILEEHAGRCGVPAGTQLIILRWVTHAFRPLRLLELADLIKTMTTDSKELTLKDSKSLVRAACGPLLEILPDETISVVHHSLTEFLVGKTRAKGEVDFPIFKFGLTNTELATTCLKYMLTQWLQHDSADGYHSDASDSSNDRGLKNKLMNTTLQLPFSKYAINNWNTHALRSEVTDSMGNELIEQLDRFLSDNDAPAQWLRMRWKATETLRSNRNKHPVFPLHIAAFCGISSYISVLLDRNNKQSIDIKDAYGRTALWWAADQGREHTVRLLLDKGAAPDSEDDEGMQPIHQAAEKNHFEVIILLLEAGIDPLARRALHRRPGHWYVEDSDGNSALRIACENGHLESLEVFIPQITTATKQKALYWAIDLQHPRLVKRILEEPNISPNESFHGLTYLQKAALNADVGSIEALVKAGADASIADGYNDPPLYKFSCVLRPDNLDRCSLEPDQVHKVFSLLIEAGGDVNSRDNNGETPLHVTKNHTLIKLLLLAGADANAESREGLTPLHKFPIDDEGRGLMLLVEEGGADINKRERQKGKTPFLEALAANCKLATMMLNYHPDCTISDYFGNGPLHTLLGSSYNSARHIEGLNDLLTALLTLGADPNKRNFKGETALHVLAYNADLTARSLVPILLAHGADLELRDAEGRTPLFKAIGSLFWARGKKPSEGLHADTWEDGIEPYLTASADLTTKDCQGRTLLHEALRWGQRRFGLHGEQRAFRGSLESKLWTYRHLIDLGLSPFEVDMKGNTLFHEICQSRPSPGVTGMETAIDILQELLHAGLDVNQPNFSGSTPLHFACQNSLVQWRPARAKMEVLTWMLEHSKDINAKDSKGLTPLHFAACMSEAMVETLLRAGVDPFTTSNDGTNALHIAARCRHVNSLGMILEYMKKLDPLAAEEAMNYKDATEQTPLHYASRSGRPESVALLLEAGADPNPKFENHLATMCKWQQNTCPPILQCVYFRDEQRLWESTSSTSDASFAVGLTVGDESRPTFNGTLPYGRPPSPYLLDNIGRLEEITRLLMAAGADLTDKGDKVRVAMEHAAKNRDDHLVELLFGLYAPITTDSASLFSDNLILMSRARYDIETRTFKATNPTQPGVSNWDIVCNLIREDRGALVKEVRSAGANFVIMNGNMPSVLQELVGRGFADILRECASPEEVALYDNEEWCKSVNEGVSEDRLEPLLITACRRLIPNMAVIRVLVEEKAVDVNVKNRASFGSVQKGTALHLLAIGSVWWEAALGIPYLVSKGADIEARDKRGWTPLHAALSSALPWRSHAVRVLIELGADVNAVDASGRDCISRIEDDEELTKLLIKHGARVSLSALEAAVGKLNVPLLKTLLSTGEVGPWSRSVADLSDSELSVQDGKRMIGLHPLLKAAEPVRFSMKEEDRAVKMEMMERLLESDAGPYDTCVQDEIHLEWAKDVNSRIENFPPLTAWTTWHMGYSKLGDDDGPTAGLVEKTVLHEVLRRGLIYEPLLKVEGLKLEHRDPSGLTPLLACCRRYPELSTYRHRPFAPGYYNTSEPPFPVLLAMGADPTAVDFDGRNILHHALGCQVPLETTLGWLRAIEKHVPKLINQVDHHGFYPLHYALGLHFRQQYMGQDQLDFFDFLASKGADLKACDGAGNNALLYLIPALSGLLEEFSDVYWDTKALFSWFIKAGVDINARNNKGQSPLHMFCPHPDVEEKLVFRLSGTTNWRPSSSLNPDDEKPVRDTNAAFALLDELGADWRARDDEGKTVLHEVAKRDANFFRPVMERGVDPLLEDTMGRSSLDVAAAYKNEEILAMFERKGNA